MKRDSTQLQNYVEGEFAEVLPKLREASGKEGKEFQKIGAHRCLAVTALNRAVGHTLNIAGGLIS